jgi:hypothetical protein
MKKVMLMLVVAMLSVVSVFAVERTVDFSYNEWTVLLKDAAFASKAKPYLDSCKIQTTPVVQATIARCYYYIDFKANGKQATPELVLAKIQEYITLVGLTDPDMIVLAKLQPLFFNGFYAEAIALGKDSQNKLIHEYMYHPYFANKAYEKAYASAIATGNKYFAFLAICKFDKVRAFEAAKVLTLGEYVTPVVLTKVLDSLGAMSFAGTTVTKDMEIDFLKSLNEKYSRFLIKDKATWEPIIAGIRLTLEVKQGK